MTNIEKLLNCIKDYKCNCTISNLTDQFIDGKYQVITLILLIATLILFLYSMFDYGRNIDNEVFNCINNNDKRIIYNSEYGLNPDFVIQKLLDNGYTLMYIHNNNYVFEICKHDN